jgi:hypothetical protein
MPGLGLVSWAGDPHLYRPLLLLEDLLVESLGGELLDALGHRLPGQEGHLLAIGAPGIARDVGLVGDQPLRFATVHGNRPQTALIVPRALCKKGDRPGFGSPGDLADADFAGDVGASLAIGPYDVQLSPRGAVFVFLGAPRDVEDVGEVLAVRRDGQRAYAAQESDVVRVQGGACALGRSCRQRTEAQGQDQSAARRQHERESCGAAEIRRGASGRSRHRSRSSSGVVAEPPRTGSGPYGSLVPRSREGGRADHRGSMPCTTLTTAPRPTFHRSARLSPRRKSSIVPNDPTRAPGSLGDSSA